MRSLFRFFAQVFSGLRFRLLVLVLIACAPLVVLMIHTAGEDRRKATESWRQRSVAVQQIARREEQEVIGGTRQLLLAVAESASVRSLNARRCKRWLDELFASYPRYTNLGVILTNGDALASAVPLSEPQAVANTRFFRRVMESHAFAVDHYPARVPGGKPTVAFGYPVLDRNGAVAAVVFAQLDLDWFNRFGSELPRQLPRGASWLQVDSTGVVLTRYPKPEDWIGRPLTNQALLAAFQGATNGLVEIQDNSGVPCVYAFAARPSRLAGGNVIEVLGITRNQLFAQADRMLNRNLGWLGLAAAVALGLGWLGSRFLIIRPVRALVRSSARLARGDLAARSGVPHSRDELGQLTLAFDQMAQALEQRERERQHVTAKLQVMSHRLVEVQESERRHIARELHDEIGQSLTAAEMHLQAALQSPGNALERRLEESIEAVERVLEQVHDLSLNLRPSMLDDLGLEPALRWYTHRQAGLTGMHATFEADPLEERLDPVIETECFRVAQEALTNVVRHAQARSVAVVLKQQDSQLLLSVRDDGVGFDVSGLRSEAVQGASLGLLSMEERASLAGGGLELLSTPGQGTEVRAWFPLKWQKEKKWDEVTDEFPT